MNLSPHFTLEELTHSDVGVRNGWNNTPSDKEVANLRRLAGLLEKVKEALGGKPVMINSGFRNKQVNDAVGSKDTSQHRIGCANNHLFGQYTSSCGLKMKLPLFRTRGWAENRAVK